MVDVLGHGFLAKHHALSWNQDSTQRKFTIPKFYPLPKLAIASHQRHFHISGVYICSWRSHRRFPCRIRAPGGTIFMIIAYGRWRVAPHFLRVLCLKSVLRRYNAGTAAVKESMVGHRGMCCWCHLDRRLDLVCLAGCWRSFRIAGV